MNETRVQWTSNQEEVGRKFNEAAVKSAWKSQMPALPGDTVLSVRPYCICAALVPCMQPGLESCLLPVGKPNPGVLTRGCLNAP